MLKKKLKSGALVIGSWVMIRDPISIEVMATSGLDWLAIDMEHAPITIDIVADLIRVGSSSGIDILVRVPDHNVTTIKQVLDAGAVGIIVPDVRTVSEARAILEYIRYPVREGKEPAYTGRRGAGLARAQGYGREFADYYDSWSSKFVFIPQIEHVDAVPNAEDIALIDGVDALFIGPYDLSASMGKAGLLENSEVVKSVDKIVCAAKAAGKAAGFHSVPAEMLPALNQLHAGVTFLAYSADVFFIREAVDRFVKEVRSNFNLLG